MVEGRTYRLVMVFLFCMLLQIPLAAIAQDISPILTVIPAGTATAKIDSGDTAWLLMSTALVMLMTPALPCSTEDVRRKDVLGTIMHSFIAIALVSVQWILLGYSLAFVLM